MPTTTNDTAEEESTAVEPRLLRGITEKATVIHEGGDVYSVTSQSGREYAVDARSGRCTCPDAEYNLEEGDLCKHAYRTLVVRGDRVIPAGVDRSAVDPLLGCAVETTPVAVATDGGIIVADDEGEILDEDGDERPEDCLCWNIDVDLACWPCFRAGFSTQNPAEPAADEDGDGE